MDQEELSDEGFMKLPPDNQLLVLASQRCPRTEASTKSVCKALHRMMMGQSYRKAREAQPAGDTVDFFPVILTEECIIEGWDLEKHKWRTIFPKHKLNFLWKETGCVRDWPFAWQIQLAASAGGFMLFTPRRPIDANSTFSWVVVCNPLLQAAATVCLGGKWQIYSGPEVREFDTAVLLIPGSEGEDSKTVADSVGGHGFSLLTFMVDANSSYGESSSFKVCIMKSREESKGFVALDLPGEVRTACPWPPPCQSETVYIAGVVYVVRAMFEFNLSLTDSKPVGTEVARFPIKEGTWTADMAVKELSAPLARGRVDVELGSYPLNVGEQLWLFERIVHRKENAGGHYAEDNRVCYRLMKHVDPASFVFKQVGRDFLVERKMRISRLISLCATTFSVAADSTTIYVLEREGKVRCSGSTTVGSVQRVVQFDVATEKWSWSRKHEKIGMVRAMQEGGNKVAMLQGVFQMSRARLDMMS